MSTIILSDVIVLFSMVISPLFIVKVPVNE